MAGAGRPRLFQLGARLVHLIFIGRLSRPSRLHHLMNESEP
jgi:hypothetical protein